MQNPPQKGGFFYFTGVVAQQVAREGFSGEMWVCLNLNEVKIFLDLNTPIFIPHPKQAEIPYPPKVE